LRLAIRVSIPELMRRFPLPASLQRQIPAFLLFFGHGFAGGIFRPLWFRRFVRRFLGDSL
jgi:hypothetical protein